MQRLGLGHAVEQEGVASRDPAVAHGEDLERRALALDAGGEQVALPELGGGDALRGLQTLQGPHLVAQGRCLLEALLGGGSSPSRS